MKIVFYTSNPDKFAKEISSTRTFSSTNSFEFSTSYDHVALIKVLLDEPKNNLVAILTVLSAQEIDDLVTIKQLFDSIPLILILPDEDNETLRKAHKLHPRFLTSVNHDFNCVISVMKNLAGKVPQSLVMQTSDE